MSYTYNNGAFSPRNNQPGTPNQGQQHMAYSPMYSGGYGYVDMSQMQAGGYYPPPQDGMSPGAQYAQPYGSPHHSHSPLTIMDPVTHRPIVTPGSNAGTPTGPHATLASPKPNSPRVAHRRTDSSNTAGDSIKANFMAQVLAAKAKKEAAEKGDVKETPKEEPKEVKKEEVKEVKETPKEEPKKEVQEEPKKEEAKPVEKAEEKPVETEKPEEKADKPLENSADKAEPEKSALKSTEDESSEDKVEKKVEIVEPPKESTEETDETETAATNPVEKIAETMRLKKRFAHSWNNATPLTAQDIASKVKYPESVTKSLMEVSAAPTFRYSLDFLLQFQPLVTEQPPSGLEGAKAITEDCKGSKAPRASSRGSGGGPNQQMGSFSNFGRGGPGGPGGRGMPRMGSSSNMRGDHGGHHGSHRGGDRGDRQDGRSARNNSSRNRRNPSNRERYPPQGANQEIIEYVPPPPKSENSWAAKRLAAKKDSGTPPPADGEAAEDETPRIPPDVVQKKVNSMLNKMTLEKFEKISDQILEIASQSKHEHDGRTLRQVLELTFAKATDEAHWASMYARFCKKTMVTVDPDIYDDDVKDKNGEYVRGGALYRKYLLNRCQDEFEKGWEDKLPTNEDGSPVDPDNATPEYDKAVVAKRRGLGLMVFIGELFMLNMLSENIMRSCLTRLISPKEGASEETIESLCKLTATVGLRMDESPASRSFMDMFFQRLTETKNSGTLPSRLKFKILDLLEMRAGGWKQSNDQGPKTISEIQDEAAAAKEKQQQQQDRDRSHRGGNNRRGGHPMGGRSESYRGGSERDRNTNSLNTGDLKQFGKIRSDSSNTFGPPSSMMGRGGSNASRNSSQTSLQQQGRQSSSSPGIPLSKDSSRASSKRGNIFEHLMGDGEGEEEN
ncbi:Eukaryotic translation initiation factor 4 gamma [Yarrowia sp. E02]|nr:Eukaryotic translation initiation factor 4 gamma [Yarrowia sp. E02]